jgi:hypothetical protein
VSGNIERDKLGILIGGGILLEKNMCAGILIKKNLFVGKNIDREKLVCGNIDKEKLSFAYIGRESCEKNFCVGILRETKTDYNMNATRYTVLYLSLVLCYPMFRVSEVVFV